MFAVRVTVMADASAKGRVDETVPGVVLGNSGLDSNVLPTGKAVNAPSSKVVVDRRNGRDRVQR